MINNDKYTQKNIFILKSFSKIKNHPLNKAWNFMVNYLKEFIINEIIATGKSQNFSNISNSMKFKNDSIYTFPKVSLSYDDSMDIILSTIKEVYKKKEEIITNAP